MLLRVDLWFGFLALLDHAISRLSFPILFWGP